MRTIFCLQRSWVITMAMIAFHNVGSVYATGPTFIPIQPNHPSYFHDPIADANTPAANPYMQDEYNNNVVPVPYQTNPGVNVYAPGAGVGVHPGEYPGYHGAHPGGYPGGYHGGHPGGYHGGYHGGHSGAYHGEHHGEHEHSGEHGRR